MKISTQSSTGLRAFSNIGSRYCGNSTQVKDISARQAVSPRYIEQLQKLKKRGSFKASEKKLLTERKLDEVTVRDIVRATEGNNMQLVRCLNPRKGTRISCRRMDQCGAGR